LRPGHSFEKGLRSRAACVRRQKGAYAGHGRHSRCAPAADVLVERIRLLKSLPSRPHAVPPQRSAHSPARRPCPPRHAAAPYIALQYTTMQQVVPHRTAPSPTPLDNHTRGLAHLHLDTPTSAPGLAHIRGGPSPHLRRDHLRPGPLLHEDFRVRSACVRGHKGGCLVHGRHGSGVPAADVLVERIR
jgi:hypothetical protein